MTGAPDAYVIDSGEVFWGGAATHAARDALIVRPVTLALPTPALDEGAAREPVEDLWQELGERDDRTSPEEYPEMCLITFDELSDFISRAHLPPTRAADVLEPFHARQAADLEAEDSEHPSAFIVWNEGRTEAVVFTDLDREPGEPTAQDDAATASLGDHGSISSVLAEAFHEAFEDDNERPIERIALSTIRRDG